MEKIIGTINKVTYYNDENGFGVVRITLDFKNPNNSAHQKYIISNNLTVTTNFTREPVVGEAYEFHGDFVNTNYGLQFKAHTLVQQTQKTLAGVVSFLSSDLFPGIGKKTATKIYEILGSNCLDIIASDQSALDKVDKLTSNQKKTVYQNIIENKQTNLVLMTLLNYGLTMHMSVKIQKKLKDKALKIIQENPYQLINLVDGIGFFRADQIALKVGIKENSPIRIQALITYYLRVFTYSNGNTFLDKNELFEKLSDIINKEDQILTLELFEDNLEILSEKKVIIIDEDNHIFDKHVYQSEEMFSEKVFQLLSSEPNQNLTTESINQAFQKVQDSAAITYSPKQKEAIMTALKESFSIITGGPGTGKSTIIKAIIDSLLLIYNNKYKDLIALLAPTGRAAKRLQEVTNHPAMTIHKFLGYDHSGKFRHGPNVPVDAKVVIVDEASMIDINLVSRLFSSLLGGTKVVLVGDADQLPSVGPGQVLLDLINSKEVTTVRLNTIHRQAENSSIVNLAHSINQGMIPDNILEKQNDRNFIVMNDFKILNNIVTVVKQGISAGFDLIRDIQVLVPMYKGDLGIDSINLQLQNELNPLIEDEQIIHLGRSFRVNDKVIQLVNRSEKQVMNGDIGFVQNFDRKNGKYVGLEVRYDFGAVYYKIEELDDLTLAYAISIHKSQGSEFDLVVMPFSFKYYIMLKRKLIYTGITRAKKFLIMLGNPDALNRGIAGIEEHRKSKIIEKIQKYFSNDYQSNLEKIVNLEEDDDRMEEISPYDFMEN